MDQEGREVNLGGTWGAALPVKDSDVMEKVKEGKWWIVLQPGEVYGSVSEKPLPSAKGRYHFVGTLYPPTVFSEEQKKVLVQNDVRLLQNPVVAKPFTITIR